VTRIVPCKLAALAPVFALLLSYNTSGQPPQNTVPPAPAVVKKAASRAPSAPAFDDIEKLTKDLRSIGRDTKGEFETSEEFAVRVKAHAAEGRAVKLLVNQYPGVLSLSYDADKSEMTASLHAGSPEECRLDSTTYRCRSVMIPVTKRIVASKRYVGSNAFGASVVVDYAEYSIAGVFPVPESAMKIVPRSHDLNFIFSMDRNKARKTRDTLGLVLIGKVSAGELLEYTFRLDPTLETPWERVERGQYVPFLLDEVRVVNPTTLEVESTFTAEMRGHN